MCFESSASIFQNNREFLSPSLSVQLWSATVHADQGTGLCAYAVHGDDKRPSKSMIILVVKVVFENHLFPMNFLPLAWLEQ